MNPYRGPVIARLERPLALAAALLTGSTAGAMLLIRVVLVPFWRGAEPSEFRRWFTDHSGDIRSLMLPLGVGAGLASTATAVAQAAGTRRPSRSSVVATAGAVGVIAITATVNEPANHRFAEGDLTDTETGDLLRTWARWHDARVVLGMAAAVAAARVLADPRSGSRRHRYAPPPAPPLRRRAPRR